MKPLLLFALLVGSASATPFDWRLTYWNAANSMQSQVVPHGDLTKPSILLGRPGDNLPLNPNLGNGIIYDSVGSLVLVDPNLITTATQTALNAKADSSALGSYVLTSDFTWANLTGKPTFATVATSGAYADLTGKPSLFSGAYADLTGKPALFDGQYSSLTGVPSTFSPSPHTHPQSEITGLVTALAGKEPTITAGTTGQYWRGDKTWQTLPTQVQPDWNSVSGLGQILNKPTIPTNTNQLTNGSGFITQAGARSAISLTTTGSGAATYDNSTGVLNVPTPPTVAARSFTAVSAPALNTAVQLDSSRDVLVSYSVDISVTSLLLAGTAGTVVLEYADNSGMTTNVVTVTQAISSTGGVLNVTNVTTANLTGVIPAGKYRRIRTVNTTGTPAFTSRAGQETKL